MAGINKEPAVFAYPKRSTYMPDIQSTIQQLIAFVLTGLNK